MTLSSTAATAAQAAQDEMIWIEGGTFYMGSDRHYPEEGPVRRVQVDGFWIDPTPVTNRDFARFVSDTGYKTVAEHDPDPALYPGADPSMLKAGSIVFDPPTSPADPRARERWWRFCYGACWHLPDGETPLTEAMMDHPVVHIAYSDAAAYAEWADKALPTEAEWEFAARGGRDGADFPWGDELMPGGQRMANTWNGAFPFRDPDGDGDFGTSRVGSYPANGFGLFDVIGNVWEWTEDFWSDRHQPSEGSCCVALNPRRSDPDSSFDRNQPAIRIPRKVLKGGSHMCAPNYCQRYRPAARHAEMVDSATTHIGFRCVRREPSSGKSAPTGAA
ncbi:formylglycine-generating enzyme family protein [Tianweitania sp. BSSL-BM11]|uniref:Formylglycine-generating enzyme family protein n=1 Tax=Tianweitania aestuarii TaxID=2814886 RepID=A0ABS5S0J6_9HYPH|nr:formylglycine-generating enzyme family protein [Tianweitania aestuarii]MBS9722072.1 formylglycine-generating enzyme family protein [Tianweitania aestuarii]